MTTNESDDFYKVHRPAGWGHGGQAANTIDLDALVVNAIGAPLENILVEYVSVRQNKETEDFTGQVNYRLLHQKKRFVVTFSGKRAD